LKLENKFAPIPLTIPLISDINIAVKEIAHITNKMKKGFGEVYATYALSYYSAIFSPHWLTNMVSTFSTTPFTLAFSNIPGLLSPITINGQKSIKMQPYIQSAGKLGLAFSCLSYCDYFKI
jgi:hypothetical protein